MATLTLTGRVLAVFDDAGAAARGMAEVRAAGALDVTRLEGLGAADRIDAVGARRGVIGRVGRAIQFGLEDQMPALAWYEAALRSGRIVLAVRVRSRPQFMAVARALDRAGGHFINRFGRLETEEFARWRGVEPAVSDLLK